MADPTRAPKKSDRSGRAPSPRTRAREVAMQFLYQWDLRGDSILSTLDEFLAQARADDSLRTDAAQKFAEQLIRGAIEHREEIDKVLQAVATNWDLRRMAAVDRNVLRIATYELLHCHDVPPKVTINEAIEIGKSFSTANTGGFVNGILDRIRIDYAKRPSDEPGAKSGKKD